MANVCSKNDEAVTPVSTDFKGTVDVAVAGKKLGQYLDKKLGTEDKSAFPVKKGYRPATGKKKSLIGD